MTIRFGTVKLFQCVVMSSVSELDATRRAYWLLELSNICWHCGMLSGDVWSDRSRCCAELRSIRSPVSEVVIEPVYNVWHRDSTRDSCWESISYNLLRFWGCRKSRMYCRVCWAVLGCAVNTQMIRLRWYFNDKYWKRLNSGTSSFFFNPVNDISDIWDLVKL